MGKDAQVEVRWPDGRRDAGRLQFEPPKLIFRGPPRVSFAAEALGRRKEHISRSMAKLKAKGVVIAGPKVGRSATKVTLEHPSLPINLSAPLAP